MRLRLTRPPCTEAHANAHNSTLTHPPCSSAAELSENAKEREREREREGEGRVPSVRPSESVNAVAAQHCSRALRLSARMPPLRLRDVATVTGVE